MKPNLIIITNNDEVITDYLVYQTTKILYNDFLLFRLNNNIASESEIVKEISALKEK